MFTIIGYAKCSTCKRAVAWLEDRKIPYVFREITQENPTQEELQTWKTQSGLPLKRFFNTSGLKYRALGLSEKLPLMPEAEQLRLLASDGMLVKRPLAIGEKVILVGFREKEWQEKLIG